jgi:putative solute:sodium symporter small subunit
MQHDSQGYWSATLGLLTKILIIWFLVSFGAGILFAPLLNQISLGGYPLGFWFAQQGSIWMLRSRPAAKDPGALDLVECADFRSAPMAVRFDVEPPQLGHVRRRQE